MARKSTALTTASDDRRVPLKIVPERVAILDQIMVYCDLKTRKDFINNAITLFKWAVEEVRKGNQIASYNPETDKVEVVRLPVLETASHKAQSTRMIALVDTAAAGEPSKQGLIAP